VIATAPSSITSRGVSPFPVKATCNRCGAPIEVSVRWAVYDSHAEGWDGVVLGGFVECVCGAADDYTLSPDSHLWLTKRAFRNVGARTAGSEPFDPRIVVGRPVLAGGSPYRRASEGLAKLQAATEESGGAEAWRRLGNFLDHHGRMVDARAAWLRATAVDADEALAACSIADAHFRDGETLEGFRWVCRTTERLPRAKMTREQREDVAEAISEMIAHVLSLTGDPLALEAVWPDGEVRGQPVVRVSAVDLRRVRDWDALAAFLASEALVGARLKSELPPQDEETQLETLLNRGAIPLWTPPAPTVRAKPKAGRNERCPCGSGRKYKKCCGGAPAAG
jgi:hypothetical protein